MVKTLYFKRDDFMKFIMDVKFNATYEKNMPRLEDIIERLDS